jgi:hypothetical protein
MGTVAELHHRVYSVRPFAPDCAALRGICYLGTPGLPPIPREAARFSRGKRLEAKCMAVAVAFPEQEGARSYFLRSRCLPESRVQSSSR